MAAGCSGDAERVVAYGVQGHVQVCGDEGEHFFRCFVVDDSCEPAMLQSRWDMQLDVILFGEGGCDLSKRCLVKMQVLRCVLFEQVHQGDGDDEQQADGQWPGNFFCALMGLNFFLHDLKIQ